MRRKRLLALTVASLALAAVFISWQRTAQPPETPTKQQSIAVDSVPASAAPELPNADLRSSLPVTQLPSSPGTLLPAVAATLSETSLRGTQADGEIRFRADGRLIIDRQLRYHMDWWLGLLGEMPLPTIRQLLESNLANLDPLQAAQVLAFFDRWTDYLQAADALPVSADASERLAQLSALRRRWFGAEAQALFGDEEAYTRATLARQQALTDPSLNPEERAAAIRAADEMLTPEQRQMRQASTDPLLASEQTAQFEALGASAEQRHQERSAIWGEEAADRLGSLDAERARWQARLDAFRAERAQILADATLNASEQQARITQILQRDFDPAEARRALALAEIADRESGR